MHAENKPLTEYGDSQSVHHMDSHIDDEAQAVEDGSPARLVVVDGPGNLSLVEWNKGDAPIPQVCAGHWNHKGKAQDSINAANAALAAEALKSVPKSKTDPAEAKKTVRKSTK